MSERIPLLKALLGWYVCFKTIIICRCAVLHVVEMVKQGKRLCHDRFTMWSAYFSDECSLTSRPIANVKQLVTLPTNRNKVTGVEKFHFQYIIELWFIAGNSKNLHMCKSHGKRHVSVCASMCRFHEIKRRMNTDRREAVFPLVGDGVKQRMEKM